MSCHIRMLLNLSYTGNHQERSGLSVEHGVTELLFLSMMSSQVDKSSKYIFLDIFIIGKEGQGQVGMAKLANPMSKCGIMRIAGTRHCYVTNFRRILSSKTIQAQIRLWLLHITGDMNIICTITGIQTMMSLWVIIVLLHHIY